MDKVNALDVMEAFDQLARLRADQRMLQRDVAQNTQLGSSGLLYTVTGDIEKARQDLVNLLVRVG